MIEMKVMMLFVTSLLDDAVAATAVTYHCRHDRSCRQK